jgi:hypothetical protein
MRQVTFERLWEELDRNEDVLKDRWYELSPA